jgi:hypothetical protein
MSERSAGAAMLLLLDEAVDMEETMIDDMTLAFIACMKEREERRRRAE